MDELDISGKRYISSKKAAKQHRYHSDYIGQLIRAGKVVGTKVGRAWYVDIVSLEEYLGKEHSTPVALAEGVMSAQTASPFLEKPSRSSAILTEEKEIQKVPDSAVHPISVKRIGLTYLPDDAPLLPEIRNTARVFTEHRVEEEFVRQTTPTSRQKKIPLTKKLLPILTLFVLGIITLAVAAFGSSRLVSTMSAGQGKPASAGISFQ